MKRISSRVCCLSVLLATACGYTPQSSREDDAGGLGGSAGGQVSSTNRGDVGAGLDGALAPDGGTTKNDDAPPARDARPGLPDGPINLDGAAGGSIGSGGTAGSAGGGAMGGIATGTTSARSGATSTGGSLGGTTTGGSLDRIDAGISPDAAPVDVPTVVTCPSLVAPLHGDLKVTSSNAGGSVTYTCSDGYGPPRPASRTCQADGTWSGTDAICPPVNCGSPPKPDNGGVEATMTTFESSATYFCDPNYRLDGDTLRTCQANGTWSGPAPTCKCAQTMCNGTCADLKTDNRHCGACDKGCSAVSPSTAQCTPTGCLVTLATGMSLGDIAVDAANVYWADSNNGNAGSVNKVPIGGGSVSTLVSGVSYPVGLALDATSLYFASANEETVNKVPIAGGPVTTLATGRNGACCLVLNTTDLYFLSSSGIVRLPLAGGEASVLNSTYGPSPALALDANNLYWRVDIPGGITAKLMKMPIGASGPPTALTTSSSIGAIAVDSSSVYWTMPAGTTAGAGAMAKMPISGGVAPTTLASGLNEPSRLAVDGTHVYFTCNQDGTVAKIPIAGGAPKVIASGQRNPFAIVVDGTSVYWTNYGGSTSPSGAVMKLTPK